MSILKSLVRSNGFWKFIIVCFLVMISILSFYFITKRSEERLVHHWDERLTKFEKLKSNIIVSDAYPLTKEDWDKALRDSIDQVVSDYAVKTNMAIKDILRINPQVPAYVMRWAPGDVNKRWYSEKNKQWRAYTLKYFKTKPDIDGQQIALGYAMFHTEGDHSGEWTVGVLPFKFKANIARLQAESGEYTYAVEIVMVGPHNGPVELRGKEWKFKLDKESVNTVISPDQVTIPNKPILKPKWHWNAYHIKANMGGCLYLSPDKIVTGTGTAGIGFSPFGYGVTKNDLTWEFATIGVDYLIGVESVGLSFGPASWRPFNSFITNTRWNIIQIGWDPFNGGYYFGTTFGVDF